MDRVINEAVLNKEKHITIHYEKKHQETTSLLLIIIMVSEGLEHLTITGKIERKENKQLLIHAMHIWTFIYSHIIYLSSVEVSDFYGFMIQTVEPLNGTSIHDYLDNKNTQSMFLSPVTKVEVVSIVRTCNSKTSTDSNGINMAILKKTIQYITKPLNSNI